MSSHRATVIAFPHRRAAGHIVASPGLGMLPRGLSAAAAMLLVVVGIAAWSRSDLPSVTDRIGVAAMVPVLPF